MGTPLAPLMEEHPTPQGWQCDEWADAHGLGEFTGQAPDYRSLWLGLALYLSVDVG